jgi:glycosyltransferase involved in cell wall biosynthesis
MEQRLISCIVPVFDGERHLSEAINSLLAQTCVSGSINPRITIFRRIESAP